MKNIAKTWFTVLILCFGVNYAAAQEFSFGIGAGIIQTFSPYSALLNLHVDVTARPEGVIGVQFALDTISGPGGIGVYVNLKPLYFVDLFTNTRVYFGPDIGLLITSTGQGVGLGLTLGMMQYINQDFLWFVQGDFLLGGVLLLNLGVRLAL
jgi:hypothetical protein